MSYLKYTILFLCLGFTTACYNPYMRINASDDTLARDALCTSPILEDVKTRTAGLYIISRFTGGDLGDQLESKSNFLFMELTQQFPGEWITSFEQGALLTLPASSVFHESDDRHLTDIGKERLAQVSALVAEYPEVKFIIEGHNASQKSRKKNLKLAYRQVKSVGRFLRKQNVDKERFEVISYGCQQRITQEGSDNNRIEIAFVAR